MDGRLDIRGAAGLRAWAVALLALAASCGERPSHAADGGGLRVSVDTTAGVVRVRNAGRPVEWSLTELLTLGSVGGGAVPAPDEFGRIGNVIADAAGRIYVADAIAHEVRVFGPDGALVRRIGREGGGPGEFGALQSIGWLGERLAVLDPRNGRLGLFSRTGEWLAQRPYMALTGSGIRLYPAGAGELYMPMVRVTGAGTELVYIRQTLEGPADTLPYRRGGTARPSLSVTCRHSAGRGISVYTADLAPEMLRVPAPGVHWAEAWTADYRIAFTAPTGDTVRIIERDLPRLPVSDAAWQREEAAFREFLDQFPDERCEPDGLQRPEAMARLRTITFDDVGRMWVERRGEGGFMLDAFDPAGRLLGEVAVPDRLERVPPFIRGDRLYLVVVDEFEVEYVKVFDIAGA
ncbi:MAG TPA: 6-bladed beta-propeller [Longimicrobiales bacterium]